MDPNTDQPLMDCCSGRYRTRQLGSGRRSGIWVEPRRSAFFVGLIAALAVVKLTSTSPVSESGLDHVVWFMAAAIANFDGVAALIGGTALVGARRRMGH